MKNKLKPCPVCGGEPTAIYYCLSNPPKYEYQHCGIHGGYDEDWHKARKKWNELVEHKNGGKRR